MFGESGVRSMSPALIDVEILMSGINVGFVIQCTKDIPFSILTVEFYLASSDV